MNWWEITVIGLAVGLWFLTMYLAAYGRRQIKIHEELDRTRARLEDYEIPGEDIVLYERYAGEVEGNLFGFDLMVLKDHEALNRNFPDAHQETEAASLVYDKPDENGSVATFLFAADSLTLEYVAHEVTHVVLYQAGLQHPRVDNTEEWLLNHPEWVPTVVGEMTDLICHALMIELEDEDVSQEDEGAS